MNVQSRADFITALDDIARHNTLVVDTETNTLAVRQQEKMPLVSIQVHVPESGNTYNFSFRHGYGDLLLTDGSNALEHVSESLKSFDGRNRRAVYWMRLYQHWLSEHADKLGNLPIEWLDELKEYIFGEKHYIFHNANFDIAVMEREGFDQINDFEDTMIALQMVWGDWGGKRNNDDKGIRVRMPQRYYDADKADYQGYEWGNRQLKWQARFWDLDDADVGEKALAENAAQFQYEVVEYAVKCAENDPNLHDYLFELGSYASWRKNPESVDSGGELWHDRQVLDTLKKVSWNDKELKGRMWMLPSDYTAKYGELDVILTWQVLQKTNPIIDGWGTRHIYETLTKVNSNLCLRMERNGVKIDIDEANRRIAENYATAQAIMDKYDWNIDSWQEFKKQVGDYLGLPDTQAETVRSALEWIDPDKDYWIEGNPVGISGEYAIQVIEDRLEYKRLIKQTSTYLGRWTTNVDRFGYGHFSIDPVGTKTGRATSGGDMGNGQNIPDRKATVKEVLVCDDDEIFIAVDYTGLELHIGAWIAETLLGFDAHKTMTNTLKERDVHTYTAEMLDIRDILYPNMSDAEVAVYNNMANFKQMDEETLHKLVTKFFVRQVGKTANFSNMYNGSHWALGLQLGYKFDDDDSDEKFEKAKELLERWHRLYPAFRKAQRYYYDEAMNARPTPTGKGSFQYNITPLPHYGDEILMTATDYWNGRPIKHHLYDRVRYVRNKYNGKSEKVDIMNYSADKAWNNIVQGTAGQICLISGNRFYEQPSKMTDGVKLFVNIHDALDGVAKVDKLEQVAKLMQVMTNWQTEPMLKVELEAGFGNWQSMNEVHDIDLWVQSKGQQGYA